MNITIQKINLSDVNKCSNFICESIIGKRYDYKNKKITTMLINSIEKEENIYTALLDNNIVGLLWYDLKGAFCLAPYLRLIVIDEQYKGMKIGTTLMNFYENQCRKTEKPYFLLVSDFNNDAIKFYEKREYKKIGVIPSFVKQEINEIIMTKKNKIVKHKSFCSDEC